MRLPESDAKLQVVFSRREAGRWCERLHVLGRQTGMSRSRWRGCSTRRDSRGFDGGLWNLAAESFQKGIRIGLDEFQSQVVPGGSRGDDSPR